MPVYIVSVMIILQVITYLIWRWYTYQYKRVTSQQKIQRHTDSSSNIEPDPLDRLNPELFQRLYTKLMLAGFVPITSVDILVSSEQKRQKQMAASILEAFVKEPEACWRILETILPGNMFSKELQHELKEFIQVQS